MEKGGTVGYRAICGPAAEHGGHCVRALDEYFILFNVLSCCSQEEEDELKVAVGLGRQLRLVIHNAMVVSKGASGS
eukprot:scaffold3369_cov19-Tisochrysis_lutea.AAC.1